MPRLLAVVLILAISTMCFPNDWTVAQESEQKCKECPTHQSAETRKHLKFELPGIDFPMGIHIEVEHNETADDHTIVEGSIEIECECLNNSGIPFLTNLPMMGNLFANVKQPSHPPCCAIAKTDSCDGKCCAIDSDGCADACKACKQESNCEKCDDCPAAKNGVPLKGTDRLFTAVHGSSNSCQASEQSTKCQTCEGCSAACSATKIQSTGSQKCQKKPQGVQLVGYVATSADEIKDSSSETRENVYELRLQNERLKMAVEAAEIRLEMMAAMMEMREENAILRTKIEFLKAHHGHAATSHHSPHHAK